MARSPGPDRVEQRVNLLSFLRPIMGPQPGNGDPIPDNNGDRSGEYDRMEKWLDSDRDDGVCANENGYQYHVGRNNCNIKLESEGTNGSVTRA